jgi:hypothetical protein
MFAQTWGSRPLDVRCIGGLGRIPAQALYIRAVDAVVHATHVITADIYGLR